MARMQYPAIMLHKRFKDICYQARYAEWQQDTFQDIKQVEHSGYDSESEQDAYHTVKRVRAVVEQCHGVGMSIDYKL